MPILCYVQLANNIAERSNMSVIAYLCSSSSVKSLNDSIQHVDIEFIVEV